MVKNLPADEGDIRDESSIPDVSLRRQSFRSQSTYFHIPDGLSVYSSSP